VAAGGIEATAQMLHMHSIYELAEIGLGEVDATAARRWNPFNLAHLS
jgi:hypothetical protein